MLFDKFRLVAIIMACGVGEEAAERSGSAPVLHLNWQPTGFCDSRGHFFNVAFHL